MAYHITLRPRIAGLYSLLTPETVVEFVNLLIALAQLAVTFGFYPWMPAAFYEAACWVYFGTSIVGAAIAINASIDSYRHICHLLPRLKEARGKAQLELEESALYVLSSITFAVGSILYLPEVTESLYGSPALQRSASFWGTTLFFIGSFILWLASFVNSLSVYEIGTFQDQPMPVKLGIMSLGLTQFGSICYVIGTVGYFPEFDYDVGDGHAAEWNLVQFGTHFYLAGGAAFLTSTTLNFWIAWLKHSDEELVSKHKAMWHRVSAAATATNALPTPTEASVLLHPAK